MRRSLFKSATVIGAWRRAFGAALAALCLAVGATAASAQDKAHLSLSASFKGVTFIPDLRAVPGPTTGQILLQWTAPGFTTAASTLTYQIMASSVADIDTNAQFIAGQPLSAFSPTAPPIPLASGATQSLLVDGLAPCTLYRFAVRGADDGAPQAVGFWMRSVPLGFNVDNSAVTACPSVRVPQAPYGVALTSGPTSVSLSWMPVVRFEDFSPFAVSSAPVSGELSAYRVHRATSATLGGWTDMSGGLSTATLTWTDLTGGPEHYYRVSAENDVGPSARSMIRTGSSNAAFIVAPDDQSYFQIRPEDVGPIEGAPSDPNSAYMIQASSRPLDLGTLEGRVVKSVAFDAYRGGLTPAPAFATSGLGVLSLHYGIDVSSLVTPSSLKTKDLTPTPENMSVYWYNGRGWVQLYGKVSAADQRMTIQTKYFGRYQLRTVERTGAFAFNQAGVSNRLVTPNGDGKNDAVVFTYDNPQDSQVIIRLSDIRGKVVVSDLPPGPVSNSKVWDGTAGGRQVPGGIYIYQIESEGRVYSGTVVIVK